MTWIKIIWYILRNLGLIKSIISELIDLFKGLSGARGTDERAKIKKASAKLEDLRRIFDVPFLVDKIRPPL